MGSIPTFGIGAVRQLPLPVKQRPALLVGFLAVLAVVAAGCGSSRQACGPIEFEGAGSPQLVIASDLPLHGPFATRAAQIVAAIRLELRQRAWTSGRYTIGYQSCDDSSAKTGNVEAGICNENANAFSKEDAIVGVIGTLVSSCSQIEIPILNQSRGGAIPLVSPANTYTCLTHAGSGCDTSEPDKYYPSGMRNYLRVVPDDTYLATAAAEAAEEMGISKIYVLDDQNASGVGVATGFARAAATLGIEIAGTASWDSRTPGYAPLFEKIRDSGADAVFVGGPIGQNGARLIEDKVAALGPNDGDVKLIAADGFVTQRTIDEAGPAAQGMFTIAPGLPVSRLGPRARAFATALTTGPLAGQAVDPLALFGAQAAQVLLDAIAASNGTRTNVTRRLFATTVTDGLLGSFGFDQNGDLANARGAIAGFTVYRVATTLQAERTVFPGSKPVAATAEAKS